jgi:hypothetical protein
VLAIGRARDVPGQALLRGPVEQSLRCAGQSVRVAGMHKVAYRPAGRKAASTWSSPVTGAATGKPTSTSSCQSMSMTSYL